MNERLRECYVMVPTLQEVGGRCGVLRICPHFLEENCSLVIEREEDML